jgi:hypothetical protein
MLMIAVGIVLLAFLFQVGADGRVFISGLPEFPLPSTCMSYSWFGVKCPGCGLTRSVVHLAHGNWRESWRYHRLGWLMAAAILLQFPYRILGLWNGGTTFLGRSIPTLFGYLIIFFIDRQLVCGNSGPFQHLARRWPEP